MPNKEVEAIYPLSPQQLGMLTESLAAPGSGIHIEQKIYELSGELEVLALKRAWEALVERHSILRTAFVWKSHDDPLQVVLRDVALPFEQHDLSQLSEAEQEERLGQYLEADRSAGFQPA